MKIAVCTPTKDRRWSWEFSKACMDMQRMRPDVWIVLDNSSCPATDWSCSAEHPLIQYTRIYEPKPIGWLRNKCLELALEQEADYIVFWDDDDYYPPTRISTGVHALEADPSADIAGTSQMYLLVVKENALLTTGPFTDKHATAATYTIRRRYAETHRFLDDKTRGEELHFTGSWTANLIQVPSEETIVVLGHGRNTVDKSDVYRRPQVYNAKIFNADNGRMAVRVRWPSFPWELFQSMCREVGAM